MSSVTILLLAKNGPSGFRRVQSQHVQTARIGQHKPVSFSSEVQSKLSATISSSDSCVFSSSMIAPWPR